jgi:hypothetical protein
LNILPEQQIGGALEFLVELLKPGQILR